MRMFDVLGMEESQNATCCSIHALLRTFPRSIHTCYTYISNRHSKQETTWRFLLTVNGDTEGHRQRGRKRLSQPHHPESSIGRLVMIS